jgi:hypothetical protein
LLVGETVGESVGFGVEDLVGESVGFGVGDLVGESVGFGVGDLVGSSVSSSMNASGTPGTSTRNVIVSPFALMS